uniref:Zinc-type alcohol dehydrogenase superfamily n=1 Tax=Cercospora beticola TaxID=122368 RepID=A0A023PJY9_CERBT|nr:zinc-type alcohol dehydrogenase superfamily [Cercospora beticola]
MAEVQTKNIETLAYVVHDAGEDFKLENVVLDAMQPNELLVDMQYSGIYCTEGTRLHLFGVRPDGSTAASLKDTGASLRNHFFGQSSFAKVNFVQDTCVVKVPEDVPDENIPFLAAMGCGKKRQQRTWIIAHTDD